MTTARPEHPWLKRVQHDLVKRLLWPARDRRDLGGEVSPGELRVALVDEEGRSISVMALWESLADVAPPSLTPAARQTFATALAGADHGAAGDDLAKVLALEPAFEALARAVKGES